VIKIARAGNVIGEYSREDIRALVQNMSILTTDDYWCAGMPAWGKVSDLLKETNAVVPPLPSSQAPNMQSPPKTATRGRLFAVAGAAFIAIALAIVAFLVLEPGVDPKQKQEFLIHKTKAEAGDAQSQVELANCYTLGKGTRIDVEEAEAWLLRASQKGNAEALYKLGEFYGLNAPSGREDKVKAYAYATLAYDIKDNLTVNKDGLVVRSASKRLIEFLQEWTTPDQRQLGSRLADKMRAEIKAKSGKDFRGNGAPAGSVTSSSGNGDGASFVVIGGSQEERGEPPYRYYRATGEVKNVGQTAGIPQIEMKLRDSGGRIIKSVNTLPSNTPVKLQPGETCGLDQRIYSDEPNCTLEVRFIELAPLPR